jgi:pSer/pThr/pTyr-binding forkhead associated (FHA) protein
MESYGKLILLQTGGPEQEFELGKANVSLGRALTNDIILSDTRVSRSHARLECSPAGCTLNDLGSSNGTRLNGARLEAPAVLAPGDVIGLGSAQLRYQPHTTPEPALEASLTAIGLTQIDSEAMLDSVIDNEILPVSINENSVPHLVVLTSEDAWEVSLDHLERAVIGRLDENQVVLTHPKVSRRHAEVVRKGGMFVLRDLGSANGVWQGDERVDEMILQNGDEFRIGEARLVFKSGFDEGQLTMSGDSRKPARKPVVFVPGLFGSQLWLGKERIWPNVKVLFKNPDIIRPGAAPLEARGIVDEVVIIPNLIKMDQYNRLGDYLVEELGYTREVDFFEYAYDWRMDVRQSARGLAALIDALPANPPVTIIAHSLGTMVSRYYIERLGGKQRVERIILMGGPHHGVVKTMTSMLVAPEILPFGIMGEKLRAMTMTLPSGYQIIPTYPCAVDQNGASINFLEDETWLDAQYLPMLRAGREFRRELGRRSSIPALSIFGYGIKTAAQISLQRDASGHILNVSYQEAKEGDSSVLQKSSVLESSEIHPVQQYHGSLFVDNDVKMRLKLELTGM